MNRPSGRKGIICFAICLILIAGAVSGRILPFCHDIVYAGTAAAEAESLEAAEESLRAEAGESARLQEQLRTQVQALNEELEQLSVEMNALSIQITAAGEQIEALQEQLVQARESRERQYEAMKLRIQYMYENQDSGLIELILTGETIGEVLSRVEYVAALTDYDRQMVQELQQTEERITAAEEELAQTREELAAQQLAYQSRQQEIMERITQYQQEINRYANAVLLLNQQADELADAAQARRELLEAVMAEQEETINAASPAAESQSEAQKPLEPTEDAEAEPQPTATAPSAASAPETEAPQPEPGAGSDNGDVELLAAIIKSEAGNQPRDGRLAVANVVLNRVYSAAFPNSVLEVLYQPGQFTPVTTGVFAGYLAAGVEEEFYELARLALAGENVVPGALYFRTFGGDVPENGTIIGDHVFY